MIKMKNKRSRDDEWYKYANVRFTMCVSSKLSDVNYAREEIKITNELGCDTIVFFVQNEGKTIYNSKVTPKDELVGKGDLLAEIIEEGEKKKIRVVAGWFGSHCQTYLINIHPEWQVRCFDPTRKKEGEELSIETASYELKNMCYNSPFRDLLLSQIREVLKHYNVDGVYLDGMYSSLGTCCCNYCRELFNKETGHDIPNDIWDKEWREFGYRTVTETARKVREVINEVKPKAIFVLDCHASIIGFREAGEPIFMTAPFVDAYILECYWNVCKEPPYYVGMESRLVYSETKRHVWSPKWIARNPDRDYSLVPSTAAKIWLMEALSSSASVVTIDQGAFWFDRTSFSVLQDGYQHIKNLRPYLLKSKPVKYAALLHSMESKFVRIHKKPRNERQHFEGFYIACQEAHIPFDIITEKEILDGSINEYPVLILPNVEYMSDKVVEMIERYVERGGGLVMTYLTSLYTENQEKRNNFALGDIAGIRYTGEILLNGSSEESNGSTNYYQAVTEHEITIGMGRNTYSYKGYLAIIEADKQSKALIKTRDYAKSGREKDSYFVWFPGEIAHPLVITKEDKGRVIYIAGELDAAFWNFGWPEAGRILSRSVIYAGNKELPFATNCPEPVMITELITEDKNMIIFLMVNYATNNLYSMGFPGCGPANTQDQSRANDMRYSIIHKDISLTVPCVFSKAQSITGQKILLSTKNSKTIVHIPKIDEYEALVLIK